MKKNWKFDPWIKDIEGLFHADDGLTSFSRMEQSRKRWLLEINNGQTLVESLLQSIPQNERKAAKLGGPGLLFRMH